MTTIKIEKWEDLLDEQYRLKKILNEKESGNYWDLLDTLTYKEAEDRLWKIERAIERYIRTGELPTEI